MMARFVFALLFALCALTGCQGYNHEFEGSDPFVNPAPQVSTTESGVLMLLNDPQTTYNVLDDQAGVDARAASNLMAYRNGYDGVYGTEDDQLFGSLREVDEVRWVGPRTLERLTDYARDMGFMTR